MKLLSVVPLALITITAHTGNHRIWDLSLMRDLGGKCVLKMESSTIGNIPPGALSRSECELMKNLAGKIGEEIKKPITTRATPLTDEPEYFVTIGKKFMPVQFEAPEICEMYTAQGDGLACKKNDLTAAQQLLILFRKYAQILMSGVR